MTQPRAHGRRSLWITTIALTAAAAGGVAAIAGSSAYDRSISVPWWALAGLFALAEMFVFHVQIRRETQTFSLSEVPLVLGLFFATPVDLVAGQVAGAAIALVAYRRQPLLKASFNVSQFAVTTLLAIGTFGLLSEPAGTIGSLEIAAAFAATLVAIVAGTAAVWVAITVTEGMPPIAVLGRNLAYGVVGTTANTGLALIAVLVVRVEPGVSWLLALPATIVGLAYRGYALQRRRNDRLASLSEATRIVERQVSLEPAMAGVLGSARELLGGEIAILRFTPEAPGDPVLEIRATGADVEMASVSGNPAEGVWARVVAEGKGVLLPRPMENPRLRAHFATQGIRDAVVVPLWGRDGVTGTLLVGNRAGDVETFTGESLTLLETFANQVGTALENVRLLAKLQQIADELTEAGRRKDEALANVAHDMRNPLASLMSGVHLLLDEHLDATERHDVLASMSAQGDQLRTLIDELVGQAGAARSARPSRRIDIGALLRQVEAATLAAGSDHHFELAIDPLVTTIESDPGAVSRILTNLVANAFRYSPAGTTVILSVRADGPGMVSFGVADQGIGIPDDLRDRIFDRFFQVTSGNGGAGLGLSIARRLAAELGGELSLEASAPGVGSEFRLRLPAAPVSRSSSAPERPGGTPRRSATGTSL